MARVVREGWPVCPRGSQVVRRKEPCGVLWKSIPGRGSNKGETKRQELSVGGQQGGSHDQRARRKGGDTARNGGRDPATRAL